MAYRLSVAEAAKLMGKSAEFVMVALQEQRLPFGSAVQNKHGLWSYHISPALFNAYIGMKG